jgi:general secretion pathway protein I
MATGNLTRGKRLTLPNPNCSRAAAGFTLLEIMVALSIIAIVLVSVYKMHSQTIVMSNSARFHTLAPLLTQRKMAEFEIKDPADWSDDDGVFGEEFPGYSWKVSIDDVDSEILGDQAEHLKKVEVTVSYNNDEKIYSLRTYRYARQ